MDRPQRGFEPIAVATPAKSDKEARAPQASGSQKGFDTIAPVVPAKPAEKQQIAPQIRSPQAGFEPIGSATGNVTRYDPANRSK